MDTTTVTELHARIRQELLANYREFSFELDRAARIAAADGLPVGSLSHAIAQARALLRHCEDIYSNALVLVSMPDGNAGDCARRKMLPFLQAYAEEIASGNAELVCIEDLNALKASALFPALAQSAPLQASRAAA